MDELKHDGQVAKTDDLRHKRGVVIYRLEPSRFELQAINFIEKLEQILERKDQKRLKTNPNMEPMAPDSKQNIEMVANCIALSHSTLFKMVEKIQVQYGSNPYVRVVENAQVVLDFRKDTVK